MISLIQKVNINFINFFLILGHLITSCGPKHLNISQSDDKNTSQDHNPIGLAVSYQDIHKNILAQYCIDCHKPQNSKRKPLDTYENLMKIVTPGEPLKSSFYKWVTKTDGERMPYKDFGGIELEDDPLPPEKIQLIYDWIAAGAPN